MPCLDKETGRFDELNHFLFGANYRSATKGRRIEFNLVHRHIKVAEIIMVYEGLCIYDIGPSKYYRVLSR